MRPLERCGRWVSGGTPRTSNPDFWDGDIPWISAKSLKSFNIVDSADRVTQLGADEGTTIVPSGTVLFVVRGMSLANEFRVGVTARPMTFNQDLRAIIPADDIDPRYLARFLRNAAPKILGKTDNASHGTKRLPTERLGSVLVPLPPLKEQQRIATILDTADCLRRKRQQALESLGELKRAQFDEWFSSWFTLKATASHVPVSHFVERFEGGLNVATPEKATSETRYFILKVSAVTWGEYRPKESKPLPDDYVPAVDHFVREGDLLFSRANTTELVGATVYVFETPSNRVLPDKLWRFVWKEGTPVEPLFVWALFSHPRIRHAIGKRATGTSGSMKNISMDKVLSIRVPWPDHGEQCRFAAFMLQDRAIRERMLNAINESISVFDSLVHRAFRGGL